MPAPPDFQARTVSACARQEERVARCQPCRVDGAAGHLGIAGHPVTRIEEDREHALNRVVIDGRPCYVAAVGRVGHSLDLSVAPPRHRRPGSAVPLGGHGDGWRGAAQRLLPHPGSCPVCSLRHRSYLRWFAAQVFASPRRLSVVWGLCPGCHRCLLYRLVGKGCPRSPSLQTRQRSRRCRPKGGGLWARRTPAAAEQPFHVPPRSGLAERGVGPESSPRERQMDPRQCRRLTLCAAVPADAGTTRGAIACGQRE